MDRATLAEKMEACEQAPGYSVRQHCQDVYNRYLAIRDYMWGDPIPPEWRIPSWVHDPLVSEHLLDDDVVHPYLLWHDCGKPFCREVDDAGRQHFPNHAAISARTWRALREEEIHREYARYPGSFTGAEILNMVQTCLLMHMDMDAHCLSPEQVPEFAARPEAVTLLLAAVAEVHANAAMFGGYESTSFKIKIKHLERRGRQVLSEIRAARAAKVQP